MRNKFRIGDKVRPTNRAPKGAKKATWPRKITAVESFPTSNGPRSLYKVKGYGQRLFSYELRKTK